MFDIVDASGDYYADENFMTPMDDYTEESFVPEQEVLPDDQSVEQSENEPVDDVPQEEPNAFDTAYFKPGTFADSESELQWYKNRMETVNQLIDRDSTLYKTFAEQMRDEIVTQTNSEIEGFKEMHQALQTDAKGFLLQYLPEALAEHGVNPIMSEEQIMERVETDLIKHFGEGYQYRLNQAELMSPRSFTAQVWAKQQSLTREWDVINNRNKELLDNWNTNIVSKRQEQQTAPAAQTTGFTSADIDKAFESEFAVRGYSREDFDKMLNTASNRQVTLADIERIVRFDDYVKEAYDLGKQEAMKQRYQSARREGTEHSVQRQQPRPVSQSSVTDDFMSIFGNGEIPYY